MRVGVRMEHGCGVIKWCWLLLLAFSFGVNAETIPAQQSYQYKKTSAYVLLGPQFLTASGDLSACQSAATAEYGGNYTYSLDQDGSCKGARVSDGGNIGVLLVVQSVGVGCQTGQNWTVSAGNCTRPDCVLPQVRDPVDGICKVPPDPCASKAGTSSGGGYITVPIGGDPTGLGCLAGCMTTTSLDLSHSVYFTDGKTKTMFYDQTYTGQQCTSEPPQKTPTPPDKAPTTPPKKPPCLATEGVMTSSSGTIACVPEGSPGANKPIVSKQKDVQNFPDGSTKATETTTTRDPTTGVESKSISVTVTAPTAGGTGAAGTPGTTTGTTESGTTTGGDPTKPGNSKFCAENPELQMCKGGMSEEKTQKEIKELLDPQDAANTESIAAEKNGYEEKATAHKEFIDAFASKGQSDEGFMSWAWIPEVPASSCAPFTGTLAGRAISMDWCEQLGMIRDVAGYMFYILTAFGLFRIFANSTGATS